MQIWYLLDDKQQKALEELYKELSGKKYKPPVEDEPLIRVDAKMESGDELERQMKQPTKWRRRPK